MKPPAVSVVIPTYNRAGFLPDALESLRNQTFQDFEVVLVDDGSTDDTQETVRQYLRANRELLKRVRYFRFEKNGGIPRALNKGYELARGTYLCQLSSDDWLQPEKLERTHAYLLAHPRCGLVYSDYEFVDLDANRRTWRVSSYFSEKRSEMFSQMLKGCFANACTFLFTREFWNHVGPYSMKPELEWNQDYHFNFKFILQDRFEIGKIDESLACITIHSQQASKQGKCGLGNHYLIPMVVREAKDRGLL